MRAQEGRNLIEFILANRLASNGNELSSHYIRDKSFHADRRSSHGGDLVVRADLEQAFLKSYVEQVQGGGRLSVFEQTGDRFKQFFSITTSTIDDAPLKAILSSISSVIREFFPFIDADCLQASVAVSRGVQLGKHRLGVVYPKIVVNTQRALMIRAMVVYKLQELDSELQEQILGRDLSGFRDSSGSYNVTNPHWEDAVASECFLTGSGHGRGHLMLGGIYRVRCKGNSMFSCTKQSMNQCVECTGDGFLAQGEPLAFLDRFRADGTRRNEAKSICTDLVSEMCIRTAEALADGWVDLNGGVQIPFTVSHAGPSIGNRFQSEKSIGKHKIDSKLMIALALKSIHRCHPNYKRVKVREMTDASKNGKPLYYVSVNGPGSSFCCNVNKDHTDSRVYFEINSSGIQQCCWVCDKYKKKPDELSESAKTSFKIPVKRSGGSSFRDRLESEYIPIIDALRCGNSRPVTKKQRR